MYSDTHFHFHNLTDGDTEQGAAILEEMAQNRTSFAMDIGTRADDLSERQQHFEESLDLIEDSVLKGRAEKMIHFTAGIWPDQDSIQDRFDCMETLEEQIEDATDEDCRFAKKLAAIGECGLDHHWNPDGRNEEDFDKNMFEGERELFIMQIKLAKKLQLPVVIHSRDAFEDTISCIDEAGYHKGIIHCYSYGEDEVKEFLDRGWHIAFGGAVTYTKKSKLYEMENLLRYVPDDRILLETDAPYLTPVPFRGQPNTPLFIRYTYDFIATKRNITVEKLCKIVDENCKTLFKL
ncbi:MAG: TatD family hydrolase [Treponema sp.]|nr:TatD family hydrolase [Treponema sp.]